MRRTRLGLAGQGRAYFPLLAKVLVFAEYGVPYLAK